MFVIFFAIFIFVFTVRENIWLGFIALAGLFLAVAIFGKEKKRIFLLLLVAFILCLGSRKFYNYSYGTTIQTQGKYGDNFSGTGSIQDTYTAGKYIFADATSTYVLYSKKDYHIGDQIFLFGQKKIFGKDSSKSVSQDTTQEQGFLAFDYGKRLKMKGYQGVIYENNASIIGTQYPGRSSQLKKILQQKIISLYGKDRISGLILGMLIGDRSLIPQTDYQNFINSGLVHLIAVSGGNIVMITIFLGMILFFLPFYLRSAVILCSIILYSIICGLDSSVFRAVITGGLSLLALFRGKEIPIWRLLSIAFIAMLIIDPYYLVYDVGFLLSFAAVIGIILLTQKMSGELRSGGLRVEKKEKKCPGNVQIITGKTLLYIRKNYLQPSIGATMGVFPIIIFFMGQMNILSIMGNLFVLPIIPFVMIYGFISVFLFQFCHWQRLLVIEKFLVTYIYKVSELSSSFGLYVFIQDRAKRVVLLGFLMWFTWKKVIIHHSGESIPQPISMIKQVDLSK